jgi:hypothetical protein
VSLTINPADSRCPGPGAWSRHTPGSTGDTA